MIKRWIPYRLNIIQLDYYFQKTIFVRLTPLLNLNIVKFSAVKYEDTNDYHWPLISEKDDTAFAGKDGKVEPLNGTRGPFGFGDAVQLNDDKVILESWYGGNGILDYTIYFFALVRM